MSLKYIAYPRTTWPTFAFLRTSMHSSISTVCPTPPSSIGLAKKNSAHIPVEVAPVDHAMLADVELLAVVIVRE